jgi:putative spermidine/putrescine transport system substrate-binding protein
MRKHPPLLTTRRTALMGMGTAGLAAALAPRLAAAQSKPKAPLVLSVMDVGGDLQQSQPALQRFADTHPDLVSKFVFAQAPAPELAGKLKAQIDAKRLDIDLVLTGNDGLAAGIEQGLWTEILPKYDAKFPDLEKRLLPGAWIEQKVARGQAIVDDWYPSGPLLEYAPDRVKNPPNTAEALLEWCKANPNKFLYARPANSGPGRTFMMGLPYILGDKDPMDPINGWDKTWAYVRELNKYIQYYPSGTSATMKEFGEGSRDIIVTTTGWDVNPRYLGVVPEDAKVVTLKGFHWVGQSNYMAVPKGIAEERLAVVLELMAYVLEPEQQAFMYDHGYLYPGPAMRNVPIEMAPKASQDTYHRFGRPEYAALIANNPMEPPLDPKPMIAMFEKWDREVGGTKK